MTEPETSPSGAPQATEAIDGPAGIPGAWKLLAIAFGVQTAVSFVELGVPVLAPFLKEGLALSAFQVGVVVTALNVGRFAASLPAGHVADRLGERVVLVGAGLGTAAFALIAAAGPYWLVLVGLVGAGLFSGATTPAGSKLVLGAFPRERRGLPMGVRQAAIPLGALGAALTLPALADAAGWRWALCAAAVLPLFAALAALGAMSRSAGGSVEAGGGRRALREIAANRKIVLAGLWALLFVGGQYALLTYLVLYLANDLGFSLQGAFVVLAIATAAGFAGRLAWGWLSDVAFHSRRRPGLILATLAGTASSLLFAVVPAGAPAGVAILGAAVAGFCLIGWQGLWVAMVSELAPADRAGTAVGFALTFTSAGIIAWPPTLGLAADLAGSFRWSWAVLTAALFASILPLLAIGRVPARALPAVDTSSASL